VSLLLLLGKQENGGIDIQLIRNGSRGMFWLEPLVEVVYRQRPLGLWPGTELDVASLFDANLYREVPIPVFGFDRRTDYLKNSNV